MSNLTLYVGGVFLTDEDQLVEIVDESDFGSVFAGEVKPAGSVYYWLEDGTAHDNNPCGDLVSEYDEDEDDQSSDDNSKWVNVYADSVGNNLYTSKEDADNNTKYGRTGVFELKPRGEVVYHPNEVDCDEDDCDDEDDYSDACHQHKYSEYKWRNLYADKLGTHLYNSKDDADRNSKYGRVGVLRYYYEDGVVKSIVNE